MKPTTWFWVAASVLLLLTHQIFVAGCNCFAIPSPHCPLCMPRVAVAADIVFVAALVGFVLRRLWARNGQQKEDTH